MKHDTTITVRIPSVMRDDIDRRAGALQRSAAWIIRKFLAAGLASGDKETPDKPCKCTLRESLVGDGCDICNPGLTKPRRKTRK